MDPVYRVFKHYFARDGEENRPRTATERVGNIEFLHNLDKIAPVKFSVLKMRSDIAEVLMTTIGINTILLYSIYLEQLGRIPIYRVHISNDRKVESIKINGPVKGWPSIENTTFAMFLEFDNHAHLLCYDKDTTTLYWLDPNGRWSPKPTYSFIDEMVKDRLKNIITVTKNVYVDLGSTRPGTHGHFFEINWDDSIDPKGYCDYVCVLLLETKFRNRTLSFEQIAHELRQYFYRSNPTSEVYIRKYYWYINNLTWKVLHDIRSIVNPRLTKLDTFWQHMLSDKEFVMCSLRSNCRIMKFLCNVYSYPWQCIETRSLRPSWEDMTLDYKILKDTIERRLVTVHDVNTVTGVKSNMRKEMADVRCIKLKLFALTINLGVPVTIEFKTTYNTQMDLKTPTLTMLDWIKTLPEYVELAMAKWCTVN